MCSDAKKLACMFINFVEFKSLGIDFHPTIYLNGEGNMVMKSEMDHKTSQICIISNLDVTIVVVVESASWQKNIFK